MAADADQNNWKDALKERFPNYFSGIKVLDIGSADMNGTNKPWFEGCEYIGLDIKEAANVDVVSIAHEYNAPPGSFDVVISTNQLEHDMYWEKTLAKMYELLKPGGLFILQTCHTRPEHGTTNTSINDSLTAQIHDEVWGNFYKNYTIEDIDSILRFTTNFSLSEISYEPKSDEKDVYFWGIKK